MPATKLIVRRDDNVLFQMESDDFRLNQAPFAARYTVLYRVVNQATTHGITMIQDEAGNTYRLFPDWSLCPGTVVP